MEVYDFVKREGLSKKKILFFILICHHGILITLQTKILKL